MKNTPQITKRKCNYERVQVTLDMCHSKQCTSFLDNDGKIKQFEKEIDKLQEKIKQIEKKNLSNLKDEELNTYHSLCEKKRQKEEAIKELNSTTEIDYLTKTCGILFEYYDLIEKQTTNKKNPVCNILDFFGNDTIPKNTSSSSNNCIENIDYSRDRAKLMDEYLYHTDNDYIDNNITTETETCDFCNSTNLNIVLHEGIMYCNECNTVEYIISDNDKPSYKEPPKEISYFSYKRINHFNEWDILVLKFIFTYLLI